jgi:ribosomal protein S12 methylthiotransferase accessory factor YcaO
MTRIDKSDPDRRGYRLELVQTRSGTGFFSCLPEQHAGFDDHLAFLRSHPMDTFLRKHLLGEILSWEPDTLAQRINRTPSGDPVTRSLLMEAVLTGQRFQSLITLFSGGEQKRLADLTPLVIIRSATARDQESHRRWIHFLAPNVLHHRPLSNPDSAGPVPDFPPREQPPVRFEALFGRIEGKPDAGRNDPATLAATFSRAMERLSRTGAVTGAEMRHIASLSPIALLRQWRFNITVDQERHRFRFSGEQTAYGRGLTLEAARAAYAMEMVERLSAYTGAENGYLATLKQNNFLERARYSRLKKRALSVLDPSRLALEAPCADPPLVWMRGSEAVAQGVEEALIPAQCVFLFSNFDEPDLFSALGSTGLASGNTLAEAKLSALMEIIERHLDAVTLFDPRRCFNAKSLDPKLARLMNDYRLRGIHLQFQDIGDRFGIPCYRAFVTATDGSVVRGSAAHLDGPRALVSAMTETPYPFPKGPASRPGLPSLPRREVETLPVLTCGDPALDLVRIEGLLRANGYRVFYTDITRADVDLPVVRAVVPGLEITADFDRYSRVHSELFSNYSNAIKP